LIRVSFFCFHSFLSQQVNPKALNTSAINCNSLYRGEVIWAENFLVAVMNTFEESEDDSKKLKAYNDCLLGKIRENDFIEKLFAFDYLGEKQLSELEKDKLRRDFMAIRVRISHEAMGCASGL
jgi:hypothetical protein